MEELEERVDVLEKGFGELRGFVCDLIDRVERLEKRNQSISGLYDKVERLERRAG
jgi:hypothetical protein